VVPNELIQKNFTASYFSDKNNAQRESPMVVQAFPEWKMNLITEPIKNREECSLLLSTARDILTDAIYYMLK